MLATLYSLGTLATLVLSAFGLGRPLLRLLDPGEDEPFPTVVWSLGLGLATFGGLLSLAAFAGAFSPALVGFLTIAGTFWGLGELACLSMAIRSPLRAEVAGMADLTDRRLFRAPSGRLLHFLSMASVITVGGTMLASLAPPVSQTAVAEHLEASKTLALVGSLDTLHPEKVRTGLAGMLYAWALMLDGPVAMNLLGWFSGLLLLAATSLLARGLLGRAWGWCAAAAAVLTPGLAYQMATPLDDLPMAAFATLALAAWWRGAVELASPRWFLIAGILLGAALASKLVAVSLLLAVALTWCLQVSRIAEQRPEVLKGAVKTLAVALLIAGPWWLWLLERGTLALTEPGANVLQQWGPLWIALLPGLLIVRKLRGLNLIICTLVSCLAMTRLLMPGCRDFALVVPLLAIIATWVWIELPRLPYLASRLMVASVVLIAAQLLFSNLAPLAERWPVACGLETRSDYLRRQVGAYAASEVGNRLVLPVSRVLSQDAAAAYFDCPVVVESGSTWRESSASDAPQVSLAALAEAGFTHLLLCEPPASAGIATSPLTAAVRQELAKSNSECLLPLTDYRFTDRGGQQRHYQLLMLRR